MTRHPGSIDPQLAMTRLRKYANTTSAQEIVRAALEATAWTRDASGTSGSQTSGEVRMRDDARPLRSRLRGRARDLQQIEGLLQRQTVVVLHGLIGSGKSALAVALARDYNRANSHWIEGRWSRPEDLHRALRTHHVTSQGAFALFIVDGADDSHWLHHAFEVPPNVKVLITSRMSTGWGFGLGTFEVPPLAMPVATSYLDELLMHASGKGTTQAALRLIGTNPLFLERFAAVLQREGTSLDEWVGVAATRSREEVARLTTQPELYEIWHAVQEVSKLNDRPRELLALCAAAWPDSVPMRALTGRPQLYGVEALHVLGEARSIGLVEVDQQGSLKTPGILAVLLRRALGRSQMQKARTRHMRFRGREA